MQILHEYLFNTALHKIFSFLFRYFMRYQDSEMSQDAEVILRHTYETSEFAQCSQSVVQNIIQTVFLVVLHNPNSHSTKVIYLGSRLAEFFK